MIVTLNKSRFKSDMNRMIYADFQFPILAQNGLLIDFIPPFYKLKNKYLVKDCYNSMIDIKAAFDI